MPYITNNARQELEHRSANNVGELTYEIQQALRTYLETTGLQYNRLAECLGALEGAKLDLINRIITPYESQKRTMNGDVWPRMLSGQQIN